MYVRIAPCIRSALARTPTSSCQMKKERGGQSVADNRQQILTERRKNKMTYSERLANYERDKASIPRYEKDGKTYEAVLRELAKKWRI